MLLFSIRIEASLAIKGIYQATIATKHVQRAQAASLGIENMGDSGRRDRNPKRASQHERHSGPGSIHPSAGLEHIRLSHHNNRDWGERESTVALL
jgi:hypothetical protein